MDQAAAVNSDYEVRPPSKGSGDYEVRPPDFTSNPINPKTGKGEGLYTLFGKVATKDNPEGVGQLSVPYSKVQNALQSGYTFYGDSQNQYQKDKEAEGKEPSFFGKVDESIQKHLQPVPNEGQFPKYGIGNTERATGRVLYATPGFLKDLATAAFDPNATASGSERDFINMIDPSEVPANLQKQFSEDMKKDPKMAVQNLTGTLAGMGIVGAATHGVQKVGGSVLGKTPELGRGFAERITRTTPREVAKLAEETSKKNIKAGEEHLAATEPAAHANVGKEIAHKVEERTANEKAQEEHTKSLEKIRAANEKVREEHKRELAEAKAHNDKVKEKHGKEAARIQEERDAAEHALGLRRAEEQGLAQDTADYFAKEKTVKASKKGQENSAWDAWRKKTNASEGDVNMAPVIEVIQDQITNTPEAANILRNVESQEGALDPDAKFYLDHRNEVMKYFGYGDDYESLPEAAKANVDSMMSDGGRFPAGKPVDLTTIKTMPLEQIHSIKSNVGYKRYNNTYPPDVRFAMGKIYDSLDKLEQAESIKRGGGDELKGAKQETREYQDAFGRVRPTKKTGDIEREQDANPEALKERAEQERLDRASVVDPSLKEANEKVKARRENLKTLRTEDELRKSLEQVPAPPSHGDTRPGYSLKQYPSTPSYTMRDTQGNLLHWDGSKWAQAPEQGIKHQLTLEPAPPEPVQVAPPMREDIPDRPVDEQADLLARKQENIKTAAENLREQGVRRTINALYYTVPTSILSTLLGHPGYALAELASSPIISAGSDALAGLLEKPGVVRWLSEINPRDAVAWDKLPPEQKALFTNNMKVLADAAKKKGVAVSPALSAFIGGAAATQNKQTPQELLQQARKINPPKYSQTATGPNGHQIGSNDGGNTWVDIQTGQAVQ